MKIGFCGTAIFRKALFSRGETKPIPIPFVFTKGLKMTTATIFAGAITSWLHGVSSEMATYFNKMGTTHWGIVAVAAVIFGFMCLKGTNVNR